MRCVMYFEDNSEYTYFLPDGYTLPGVKNIGWLDCKHPYIKDEVGFDFINKLTAIILKDDDKISYAVNKIRGFYKCGFCNDDMIKITNGEHVKYLGMSEVWMPSICEGIYYAFPSLMLHYVEHHEYKPPEDFITSVLKLDTEQPFIAQNIYDEKIRDLNINFWLR
ncbi:hypothetical protein WJW69_004356 [Salmonella enterica]|nr:hypothetical protein [Salmonella enterica subsp. enterica serovar Oranienburg]